MTNSRLRSAYLSAALAHERAASLESRMVDFCAARRLEQDAERHRIAAARHRTAAVADRRRADDTS